MVESNWKAVKRLALLELAATVTLISLMGVLFLDKSQVFKQTAVLSVELAAIFLVASWHRQLFRVARFE